MEKYNKLTVLEKFSHKVKPTSVSRTFAKCLCDCGKMVDLCYMDVKTGHTKSCGCWKKQRLKKLSDDTIGYKYERIIWWNMKRRCSDPSATSYSLYGGRGIKVCDRWVCSFHDFISDIGRRPSRAHSIERRDNNGNYEPSNCFWATDKEQANNRRSSRMVTYRGETKSVALWSDELGLNYHRVRARILNGWDAERAFNAPLLKNQFDKF